MQYNAGLKRELLNPFASVEKRTERGYRIKRNEEVIQGWKDEKVSIESKIEDKRMVLLGEPIVAVPINNCYVNGVSMTTVAMLIIRTDMFL